MLQSHHFPSKAPTSSVRHASNNGTTPRQLSQVTRSLSSEEAAIVPVPKSGKNLRRPKTFYPLHYGRSLRDMEMWDHSFFQAAQGHPTLTPLELVPPNPVMLDVACGYGTWCILAGRFFKQSRITGFDIANIQPNLKWLGHRDLASRITWVHGDMLDGLPFPNNTFDLVHSQHIEHCVPETNWGNLIEEIKRVLKPGGIFETAQQSLIFPCPRFPPHTEELRDVAAMEADGDDGKVGISKELADIDPRDHSRLREAFDAMLEVRFLNPQIISTLPFYLETTFESVFMTPPINVTLPPSSFTRDKDETATGDVTEPKLLADQNINVPDLLRMDRQQANQEIAIDTGGHMHLNQTMIMILSTQEAIWEQFEVLNPTLRRSDFNYLLKNWEIDMRDRIDMRSVVKAGLNWPIPLCDEDPEYKHWRTETQKFHARDSLWDAQSIPESCRSMRVFRAVKHRPPG